MRKRIVAFGIAAAPSNSLRFGDFRRRSAPAPAGSTRRTKRQTHWRFTIAKLRVKLKRFYSSA
jgi:hypothetical protein